VGLGFLVVALRFVPAVYQSVFLLVVAYMAMFLPQAMSAAQTGLRQVGPSLEEASRSLGVGPFGTLWRVTLPLLGRSLLAGGGIVFLSTMKELPATLLLRPTGFETLAVHVWSASSELFYTDASVAALVLVAISAVPLYLLVARDLHRT
jgi:iron(III) transport system permease protein